ncbi:MAG TPA: replication/maintenance protein RepL, partial [Reyranella sp.]|nr:replication/maintenance protein RepL [Reyranella sp.]
LRVEAFGVKQPTLGARGRQAGRGRLSLTDGPGNSRLFIVLMATMVARLDVNRRRVYGDIDMSSIADTVGLAATEAVMREPSLREVHRSLTSIIGPHAQRGINAHSVAQATGIPRETVRRKLKLLAQRDFVVEQSPGRYIIKPGTVQKPEHLAVYERCMRDAMAFMNECLAQGLVKWESDEG